MGDDVRTFIVIAAAVLAVEVVCRLVLDRVLPCHHCGAASTPQMPQGRGMWS